MTSRHVFVRTGAEVLVAANEIRQMENGIFAGTLTPSMFDAAEARPALQFVRKG